MKTLRNIITSPLLTMLLMIAIVWTLVGKAKADEIPSPWEGAGCKDNTKINCGE